MKMKLIACAILCSFAVPALAGGAAAQGSVSKDTLAIMILGIAVMMIGALTLRFLLARFKVPNLVCDIAAGVFLGPTILGKILPHDQFERLLPTPGSTEATILQGVAWLAVFMLLYEAGYDVNIKSIMRTGKVAFLTGGLGAIITGAIAFVGTLICLQNQIIVIAQGKHIAFAAFMACIMAIAAMVVVVRMLGDLGLSRSDYASTLLSGYALNEVIAWGAVSVLIGITAPSKAGMSPWITVSVTLCACVFSLTFGQKLAEAFLQKINKQQGFDALSPWTIGLVFAWVGVMYLLGLNPMFGFFTAGLALSSSKIVTEEMVERQTRLLKEIGVPLFFVWIGLRVDLAKSFDLALVLFVLGLSILAKYVGTYLPLLFVKMHRWERHALCVGFLPGGVTRVAVAEVARTAGLIPDAVFVAILVSVMVSSSGVSLALDRMVGSIDGERLRASLVDKQIVFIGSNTERSVTMRGAMELLLARIFEQRPEIDKLIENEYAALLAILEREEETPSITFTRIAFPYLEVEGLTAPLVVIGVGARRIEWSHGDVRKPSIIVLSLIPAGDPHLATSFQRSLRLAMKPHGSEVPGECRNAFVDRSDLAIALKLLSGKSPRSKKFHDRDEALQVNAAI